MPKLKMTQTEFLDMLLRKAIAGAAAYYDLDAAGLARKAGMSRATWYRRLQRPSTFTVGELIKMARAYHWDSTLVCELLGIGGARQ